MLEESFTRVYTKFKLHFYKEIFARFHAREASLTAVETFCVETIQALGSPTVKEFAEFMQISTPNAAYKVNSLIQKGYLEKVRSESDRREYHLKLTDKYYSYYNISSDYISEVMERIRLRIPPEHCRQLDEILRIVDEELMPETRLGTAFDYRHTTPNQQD